MEEKSFWQRRTSQLCLTFPNGNSLSTIWGAGSYSDNHDKPFDHPETLMDSNTVEVMPECSEKMLKHLRKRYDTTNTVIGHLNIEQWLDIVNILAREKKTT